MLNSMLKTEEIPSESVLLDSRNFKIFLGFERPCPPINSYGGILITAHGCAFVSEGFLLVLYILKSLQVLGDRI